MIVSEDNFPKTWQDLKSKINFIKSTQSDNFRFPDNQLFYQKYQELVDKDTRLKVLIATFSNQDISISRNQFPYGNLLKFIPEKITHYCLWSRQGKLSDDEVEKQINLKFPKNDYLWFENAECAKSVFEIWHCHIFVKENN